MIETSPLDDFISSGALSLQTGPFGSQLHSYDYVEEGVPVIPTEGIQEGRIDHSVLPKITDEKRAELARHAVIEDDILFARRGAQATGRSALIRRNEDGFICGTGAIRARVNDRRVLDPKFLAWFLATPSTVNWIREQAIGATMPNLNKSIIGRIEVPLLRVEEQREIAAILGALDDKIELNRKTAATLEAMARALYRSWFVDFDPVHAKAEGRAPAHMDAATAALFPDRFGDDGLPEGWCVETVGNVFDVVMGQSPPGETYNDDGIGLPFYQGRTDFGFRFPTRRKFCSAPSRVAMRDSVLLSVRAPVGDLNRAWEDCCIGRGVASLSEKRQRNAYGYEALWALSDELKSFDSEGTVFGSINRKQLLSLTVIQPSVHLVDVFEERVLPMDRKIRNLTEQIQTLAALRDTLLPRLMSGELRVGEAREQVEAVA